MAWKAWSVCSARIAARFCNCRWPSESARSRRLESTRPAPIATAAASRMPHTISMPAGRRRAPLEITRETAADCPATRSADRPAASSPSAGDGCPIIVGDHADEALSKGLHCDSSIAGRRQIALYAEQVVTAGSAAGYRRGRCGHVPATWTPVRRQEHAPFKEFRTYSIPQERNALSRNLALEHQAVEIAPLVHVVIGIGLVHDAAVVPQHPVAVAPLVAILVSLLGCMRHQLADQRERVGILHADDRFHAYRIEEQRLAAVLGMRAHQRVDAGRRHRAHALLADRAERARAVLAEIGVHRPEP